MRVAVVDGQGGGIGKAIVEKLRQSFGEALYILALGTNAVAASLMLKAGANECASGENAILFNAGKVDAILGSVGILAANAMLGEISPAMAQAIGESPAAKILLPLNKCNITIAGARQEPLPHAVDSAVELLAQHMKGE
jgi:hypothetical protein